MKVSSSVITRQKLLDVAIEVFGELGYRPATVRDIVKRAGVNQAAINYHFRGKDALYIEATKYAFEKVNFLDVIKDKESIIAPEQQVRLFLDKMIDSLCATNKTGCKFTRLVARELAEPSGMLERSSEYHTFATGALRSFFPSEANESQIKLAAFWLLAQCSIIERAYALIEKTPAECNEKALSDFFSVLVLNGIAGIKSASKQ